MSSARTGSRNEYEDLEPLFAELAELDEQDGRYQALRDRLVTEHLPVAEHIARRFRHRGETHDDLVQVATLGLIKAVDRFDPGRGVGFMSYAVPTIMGEVRRHFRDAGWSVRMPRRMQELHLSVSAGISALSQELGRAPTPSELAAHLKLSVDDVQQGLEAGNAYRSASLDDLLTGTDDVPLGEAIGFDDSELAEVEDRETIRPLLAELPERERRILVMRFFRGMTQTEIAEQVGVSQMHVSRLLTRTLSWLRERLDGGPTDGGGDPIE
ncbi:RNA polymerase sigma-B factor [Saccharopolyspora erythraea NRRL 2338]|uniref:RNA polymerase sigma factor n=2 Tax=Saccharopolyspora erythraea TaxID=1836 RepID=A4FHE1_SACEN|nr:SigB/SigF/SigG family RNA polymerase sigma factor [Saccharopolyspora erythraea]EQD86860.1 RNA polymerase sigma factor SigF [Saccharopolyspora erythraea D]PFG97162.1 RNA polymerase sigma-B factor [Saccharopolyspora erythraea NRRL 2338]QRK87364.1 SigB/SigF/SigG family RNA polymerase sigma factor [Saccharopolyspora erythraea]CAM03466.1 RNA polymerase sigma factor [Saccharopolyspora erythraea NRRL 2338]